MTSMMAPINIGLQFRGNRSNANKMEINQIIHKGGVFFFLLKKGGVFLKPSFNSSCNKQRFSSLVTANNSHCSPREVEAINGMKHDSLIHLKMEKLANENTEDITFCRGGFVEDRFVYRQIFSVRDHVIGPDKSITMETLMNFLPETALNHAFSSGLSHNGFGATYEMDLRKLIPVVTRIQVQIQRYCKWLDEIEVDTWLDVAGKNGTRKDWIIRDHYTKEILAKATSTWVIMNRETRRLSKIPKEVRQEYVPFSFNKLAIAREEIDHQKIPKLNDATDESFRFRVTPGWNDMDANQHVNNVKYIKWILESMPREILEDYKMTNLTLEFRRECTQLELLESITSPSSNVNNNSVNRKAELQYIHLLRLQDSKLELVRARTDWLLKQNHM